MDYRTFGLRNVRGRLFIGSVSAESLAEKFDTPLYVIDERRVRENFRRLQRAFGSRCRNFRNYYAAKANTNLNVLRILQEEGAWIDAVSVGEVDACIRAGFKPENMMFTGTSVRDDELMSLAQRRVVVNFDSQSAFERMMRLRKPELVSFRINPDVGAGSHEHVITGGRESKFGIWEGEAVEAYRRARKLGVRRFGIHAHIGSGILEPRHFMLEIEKLTRIAGKIAREAGVEFEFIDFGGGLGVPYKPEQEELEVERVAEEAIELFRERCGEEGLGEPAFAIEPGRYIVADACVLLTRVNTPKRTPYKNIAGVDAGFNTLVRPMMYGAYHHILVDGKLGERESETYDVVGPICEGGDVLAKGRRLPHLEEGDLLAVLDAGAYGFSMSSRYNSRPLPAEVLVNGKQVALVREREGISEMYRGQRIAKWLR